MTETQKEILRGGLLLQFHAAYPSAMHPGEILSNLKLVSQFKQLTAAELDEHLRYLETKGLIERDLRSASIRRYLITDAGRVWLDERNLL